MPWQNSIHGYRFRQLQVPKMTLIYVKTGFACHFKDVNLLISLVHPRLNDRPHALEDFVGLRIGAEKRLVHSWHLFPLWLVAAARLIPSWQLILWRTAIQ
jgi:hypothetical protein